MNRKAFYINIELKNSLFTDSSKMKMRQHKWNTVENRVCKARMQGWYARQVFSSV